MNKPDYLISTPENVDLHLELAGLGNRVLAAFIDRLLIGAVSLFIIIGCAIAVYGVEQSGISTDAKTAFYFTLAGIGLMILFVVNAGYFIAFEGIWKGQTPGKRLAQIRVIEANGQPVGWASVCIRNLLRIVDEFPGILLGVVPMLLDKNERRFGDFAAGTIVIRERLQSFSATEIVITSAIASASEFLDADSLTPDEYDVLVTFLKRRESLLPERRIELSKSLASTFQDKLGINSPDEPAEPFLEKLYAAYTRHTAMMEI